MRLAQIKSGMTAWTKVGESRIKVVVVREAPASRYDKRQITRFIVRRADNGNELPKARNASALHETSWG